MEAISRAQKKALPKKEWSGRDNTPVIILVRPQLAENIGMAARAMANFGFSRMRLVAPRDGWPQKAGLKNGAHQAAAGAASIVEEAELFSSLESACADLTYVFATTARERGQAKPVFAPDAGMREIIEKGHNPQSVGILFGPERTGLDNDDISLADAVLTFPINPTFASLNLAQAVLLVSYEWHRATQGVAAPFELAHRTGPAKRETLFSFFSFVEQELDRVRFLFPTHRRAVMIRNFRNILHRMSLTEQDVRTMRGALDRLVSGPRPDRAKAKDPPLHISDRTDGTG